MIFYIAIIVLSCLFYIFNVCMIRDQYTTLIHATTVIDFKRKQFIEKRTFSEVLNEVFGNPFGFHWFFPLTPGGFYLYYINKIKSFYSELENEKVNKKEEDMNKPNQEKKLD